MRQQLTDRRRRHVGRKAVDLGSGQVLECHPAFLDQFTHAAWVILGIAGSAKLATATYILLNEIVGRAARRAIGALMLVTGLASSVFWPTTSFLSGVMGWRGTCLVYAGLMVLVCLPLYTFGLPRRTERKEDVGSLRLPG